MPTKGEVVRCEHCNSIISRHKVSLYYMLVIALRNVHLWCLENKRHEFKMKDVRHLFENVQYARFGDWVMFGGLVYKNGKGHYGLNIERCEAFFSGRYPIPMDVWKDPVTGEIEPVEPRKYINQIPKLAQFLDGDGQYIAEYKV